MIKESIFQPHASNNQMEPTINHRLSENSSYKSLFNKAKKRIISLKSYRMFDIIQYITQNSQVASYGSTQRTTKM